MRQPAEPAGAGFIPPLTDALGWWLGVVDLLEGVRRNVEPDTEPSALTEFVGEHREVVEQTVAARVHHWEVGRIVLDGPEAWSALRRDQEVRGARALGGLVTEVRRRELNAFVRQRRRDRQLEGTRVRKQGLR